MDMDIDDKDFYAVRKNLNIISVPNWLKSVTQTWRKSSGGAVGLRVTCALNFLKSSA